MSFVSANSGTKIEITYAHFFYYVIERVQKDAEVYVNGKLVTEPKEIHEQRYVLRWGRIITVLVLIGLGIFASIKLIGY